MNDWESLYQQEGDVIRKERESYSVPAGKNFAGYKFFEYLSCIFLFCGFVALGLVFFTEITFIQAICLFVISYVTILLMVIDTNPK